MQMFDMKKESEASLIPAVAAIFLMCGLASGCGDSDDASNDADTGMKTDTGDSCEKKPPSMPAAHACWHVCVETPIQVDAASQSSGSTPTVQFGKTYSVALNDNGAGTYSGTVQFNGSEDGREAIGDGETKQIHFHTVGDVSMSATAVDSSTQLSVADSNEYQCAQGLKYSKVFEMGPERYDVTLGPTDRQQVTLVVVPLNGPAFK